MKKFAIKSNIYALEKFCGVVDKEIKIKNKNNKIFGL